MNEFGERLKYARTLRGFSQIDLANLAGSSRSMISSYENGSRLPKGATLLRLSGVLRVPAQWLMEGEGPMESTEHSQSRVPSNDFDWLNYEGYEAGPRLPRYLCDQIDHAARMKGHSTLAEIIERLEASFQPKDNLEEMMEGLTPGQKTTLRELIKHLKGGTVNLK